MSTSRHIDTDWGNGRFSLVYERKCYHFKRRGTGWRLGVVDLLDSDESVDGRIVDVPIQVRRELKNRGMRLIHE